MVKLNEKNIKKIPRCKNLPSLKGYLPWQNLHNLFYLTEGQNIFLFIFFELLITMHILKYTLIKIMYLFKRRTIPNQIQIHNVIS